MVRVSIAGTNRTSSIEYGSVQIEQALTSQPDSCSFTCNNYQPTVGQEVLVYDGFTISADISPGTTVQIPVNGDPTFFSKFRVGDVLILGPDVAATVESVSVTAVSATSVTVATTRFTHLAGAFIVKKVFGGIILTVSSEEVSHNTSYVLWKVSCGDYQAVMDRRLINNVYVAKRPDQIVQSMIDTINITASVDAMEYASTAALQTVWASRAGDADVPTRTTTLPKIGTSSGSFGYTYATGSSNWTATLPAFSASTVTGVASGAPLRGQLRMWVKVPAGVTSISFNIGTGVGNYTDGIIPLPAVADTWTYVTVNLTAGNTVGTPDWTAVTFLKFYVSSPSSGTVFFDKVTLEGEANYTTQSVVTTGTSIAHFAVSFKNIRETMARLAEQIGWEWWVDYDRDVHFLPALTAATAAPYSITESSTNHIGFAAEPDLSQFKNRVYVRGGSEATSSQVETQYGDGAATSFFTKEKPRSIGPYLYDVLVQVSLGGAAFVTKTYGIANHDNAASYEFMLNAEEKYVTNGTHAVLANVDRIKITYTYLKPILIRQDSIASQTAMAALQPGTDGIYEAVIIEPSITSSTVARSFAQAELDRYSNALVTVSFTTYEEGLEAGQLLTVNKPSHGVNTTFLIQRVSKTQMEPDCWEYHITAASTLFGILELLTLLLKTDYSADAEGSVYALSTSTATITATESTTMARRSTKFRWAPATPTTDGMIWDRFSWN